MKLKDIIIKNKYKLLTIIGVLLTLTILLAVSYAFFGKMILNTNTNAVTQINTSYYSLTTEGNTNISLTLNEDLLGIETSSNTIPAFTSNGGNLNLNLTTLNPAKDIYCTYNIIYEPVNPLNSSNSSLNEFTISGISESGLSFSETNIIGSNPVILKAHNLIKTDASSSLSTLDSWNFTVNFYNLNAMQDYIVGTNISGNIKLDNINCGFTDSLNYGYETILTQNGGREAIEAKTVDLSTIATTNEGMYAYNEGSNKTYYYRGAVDNNWVKYGKFKEDFVVYRGFYSETTDTNNDVFFDGSNPPYYIDYNSLSECNAGVDENLYRSTYNYNCKAITLAETGDDMYWRIIRIDGSNQIRMIYTGNTPPSKGTSVVMTGVKTMMGMSAYNTEYNHAEYVGFQYTSGSQRGTNTDSTIKTYLNNWYTKYFQDNNISRKVSTTFCNDRNTSSTWASTGSYIEYAALGRLDATPPVPTFDCNTNDLFTEDLGLITADEMVLAGAKFDELNANFYLNNEMAYWSASPYVFSSSDARVVGLDPVAGLHGGTVNSAFSGVRGVVTLSSNAKLSGSGTYDDPYVVID